MSRLNVSGGAGAFLTPDYLVRISIREHSDWVTSEISLLSLIRKIAGALLFILGLWLLRRGYTKVPGIRINPGWAPVFADTVFIIALGVGFLGPLDYVLEHWFGLLPLTDGALQFTFSVMLLPCLFFFSWFVANLGGQSLEVGPDGRRMARPRTKPDYVLG